MPRLLDELLALDLLTLREHTERAGDPFDAAAHRDRLEKSISVSELCEVRRGGVLVGYAMFRRADDDCGFVTAFGIHPGARNAVVVRELLGAVADRVSRLELRSLSSNVYKTNDRSIRFHRRLGFRVTRENEKGLEFRATLDALRSALARIDLRRQRSPLPA